MARFINNLTHTGDYAGQSFKLRPWQEGPLRKLFGTLRPDGTRQYRKTFWALPRKQGKTELVAGGSLYLLLGQGRTHQRIYTASGDVEQAALIFGAAVEMVRNDPVLDSMVVIYEGYKRIDYPAGNSSLKVLSSVPKSKHGLGPTAVLIDEYHVVDEALVNVLTTGFAARKDPLVWMITTAGWDRTSLCYDEWLYALKVRDGEVNDPTYLPVIYAAAAKDDWRDERTWFKAMPALGDFCSVEFIREEFRRACERPRFENTFRQLYLNQWTDAAQRWLSTETWAACGQTMVDEKSLEGKPCYAGLDLGVTGDLSALVLLFPDGGGGLDLVCRFWAPENGKWKREPRNKELYQVWAREGWLTLTPGETTDHQAIEDEIVAIDSRHPMRLLLADRAFASQLLSRLLNVHGMEQVKGIPQGPITFNEPMVRFEELVSAGRIRHGGNPVLSWCVSNAGIKRSSTGLIYLDKSQETRRIDGLSAAMNGMRGVIDQGAVQVESSVYEERGLVVM